jgi:2-methylcitrate dehydratase PrpD
MGKAFHPGRSAQNGYAAALLAEAGFTAGVHGIEGPRGFAAVLAAESDLSKVTRNFGTDFGLRRNTYKPFPCGIVNHPTIDGAIQIHREHRPAPETIRQVRLGVAPIVLDLCNKQTITKGLEGKFSVYHGAAVGLVRGQAGLDEYTDEAVADPQIRRLRETATATAESGITDDQARITVELTDGTVLEKFVEQSLGNIHRPMSDAELSDKFRDQATRSLPESGLNELIEWTWRIDELGNVRELIERAVPE